MFDDGDLTEDGFLGGRLRVLQPKIGYRAATDPVLLAASVPARSGDAVLELGCGAGVASLCLATRVPGVKLVGVERQPAYAELARRNAAANSMVFDVTEADLNSLPVALRAQSFDHVLANPPYFRSGEGTGAVNQGREAAFREETPLLCWIEVGLRRLRPGGWLTMIHLAERLPEILTALNGKVGSVTVLPVAPRAGRPANRVILRVRKGRSGPMVLLSPFILHDGVEHLRDGDDYSAAARAVLRDSAALSAFC